MKREEILSTVESIINGPRQATYGDARTNFTHTAQMWSAYKGVDFTAYDVAVFMTLLKIDRLRTTPTHDDSWLDAVAYMTLGGEIATEEVA